MIQELYPHRKYIGFEELYMMYPYKKRRENIGYNTVEKPYVSKKDHTECEYSLDYVQWKDIMDVYFQLFADALFEGRKLTLPARLGEMSLCKYKSGKFTKPNYHETHKRFGIQKGLEKQKYMYFSAFETNGYRLLIEWKKGYFANRFVWIFRLSRQNWMDRVNSLQSQDILNFNNI